MAALRGRFQLELEMAAGDYAIAMTSPCDTEEGLARLAAALSYSGYAMTRRVYEKTQWRGKK